MFVCNVGSDRSQLARVAKQAKAALRTDTLEVADHGYFVQRLFSAQAVREHSTIWRRGIRSSSCSHWTRPYTAPDRLRDKKTPIPTYRDPAVNLSDQFKGIWIDGELDPVETANWFPKLARKD
jgi:hypothetical protein